ncbi:uncharacterized protein LOC127010777 [Drosophila biarmipes]|uniref:uncharacterized protein LOC127010777 n=1 Tax=Drosophila biarmipes TaxID=125945 RepID=UPI0021CC8866|nr:uncharacterized protein LOC127010777 [Drosophila biarmipes]
MQGVEEMSRDRVMVQEICTQLFQRSAAHVFATQERKEMAMGAGAARCVRGTQKKTHGGTGSRLPRLQREVRVANRRQRHRPRSSFNAENPGRRTSHRIRQQTPQENYSATEKECLAIIWAIRKLICYLEGYRFEVITDHLALKWLNSIDNPRYCQVCPQV